MRRPPVRSSPMAWPFLLALVLVAVLVVALVEVGALTYAYRRLGIDRRWAYLLLAGSAVGGWVNVPVARFPGHIDVTDTIVTFFGIRYLVPEIVRTDETILAVNIGGAVIPTALSVYLVVHAHLGWMALWATLIVAALVNRVARPLPGIGIAVPTLLPALFAVGTEVVLGSASPAALAYVGGTLGTLIGADIVNLPRIRRWGAPLVSIGGAGTFDGIFVTGVIAVLLAAR